MLGAMRVRGEAGSYGNGGKGFCTVAVNLFFQSLVCKKAIACSGIFPANLDKRAVLPMRAIFFVGFIGVWGKMQCMEFIIPFIYTACLQFTSKDINP